MAKYESEVKMVPQATCEQIYQKLANLETFRPVLESAADNPVIKQKLQEAGQDPSQLDKLKDVQLTNDSVSIPAPMIGSLTLTIVDREENRCVKMETTDSPLQATLWIQMLPVSAGGAKIKCTLKAELNMMMKMMIGKKLDGNLRISGKELCDFPHFLHVSVSLRNDRYAYQNFDS